MIMADVIELSAHRKIDTEAPPKSHEWTIAELRRIHAPAFLSLPFIQRDEKAGVCGRPIAFWNDPPGFDHKTDFRRGRLYAEMMIDAVADDKCCSRPLEQTFEAIIKDAVARKIKGGKHARTLPPAVDGFLWELSKFITKAASRSGGDNGAA
jgi:hypothetical protein